MSELFGLKCTFCSSRVQTVTELKTEGAAAECAPQMRQSRASLTPLWLESEQQTALLLCSCHGWWHVHNVRGIFSPLNPFTQQTQPDINKISHRKWQGASKSVIHAMWLSSVTEIWACNLCFALQTRLGQIRKIWCVWRSHQVTIFAGQFWQHLLLKSPADPSLLIWRPQDYSPVWIPDESQINTPSVLW